MKLTINLGGHESTQGRQEREQSMTQEGTIKIKQERARLKMQIMNDEQLIKIIRVVTHLCSSPLLSRNLASFNEPWFYKMLVLFTVLLWSYPPNQTCFQILQAAN